MREIRVRELMTPLNQYTTISGEASLKDAFVALEGALRGEQKPDPSYPRDFAVLVVDSNQRVIGRLVVWDVLKGLETQAVSRVDSLAMVDGYGVWSQPLANLATKAHYTKVKNLVKSLDKREYITEDATLDVALHRLVENRFLSLIVTKERQSVGVLRVVDVFSRVCSMVKAAAT
jgi:CBS domain-containing protein